jgi:hypothetical protein
LSRYCRLKANSVCPSLHFIGECFSSRWPQG